MARDPRPIQLSVNPVLNCRFPASVPVRCSTVLPQPNSQSLRGSNPEPLMSALPPKADIAECNSHVYFMAIGDVADLDA
jgi:hypothetical protein